MKRALNALAVGAFLTLAVDVLAAGRPAASLLVALAFLALATFGFEPVSRRPRTRWAYGYTLVLLLLGYAVFGTAGASVGATLFFAVLVAQSVLVLPVPAVAVLVAVVPLAHTGMSVPTGLREGFGLLVAVLFTAVLTKLLVREQEARRELAAAHRRLREYAVQVERLATVEERNRVARDIHDGLGHALTVVQMQIKAARAVLAADPGRVDAVLTKAQDQAEEALREVRRSVGALREPATPVPLPEALRALADETSAAGVPTALEVVGAVRPLSERTRESLFRAAQEGLTNVRRHARATRVDLTMDYSQPADVRLEVRDDGVGVGPGPSPAGFGLLGIEERAAHLGGRMAFGSVPGQGSTLRVEVPG
ncbi:sensor histidine kinase [Micromonospora mirobrigensis]|uniref:Oxygen sensor histidine kinase NreB n=1 Tax=Micromonospora mirobrigensis TaxID=262898 RepID=A0A1C4UX26_9ACTN|nr:sensor histidine kinase [Micromonospora mirobrigensis]SCE76283.1 Signal transduction histidine kinase [Micromonospora mirobrigensis]